MKKYLLFLLICSLAFIFASVSYEELALDPPHTTKITADNFNFESFDLPYDAPSGSDPDKLAIFAWQEMIALNWKATYNSTNKNYKRDTPDNTWNYKDGVPDYTKGEAVLWETYAHRTELRPANTTNKGMLHDFDSITRPFDSKPVYTFGTIDTTGGKTVKKPVTINPASGADVHLLNCLDEDNEIGSCILFAGVSDVDAKSKNVSALKNQVLYQAKINKVGWDYRKKHFNGQGKLKTAAAKVLTGKPPQPDVDTLKLVAASCLSDAITKKGFICFPCSGEQYSGVKSQGVIEIKTAWRKYDPQGIDKNTNLDHYLHRKAIYFSKDKSKDTYTANNDIFLLIGFHINRKTKNYPTFVIATFEHESVNAGNYKYLSTPGVDADYPELYKVNPALRGKYNGGNANIYKTVNDAATAAISVFKPNHYLSHYRLAGVQGSYPDGYPKDKDAPSFFLSNLVIESDMALSNFYGTFAFPQKGKTQVAPGFFNLISINKDGKPTPIIAGGCKGCHGIRQIRGADMSFLMDSRKPAAEPDEGLISGPVITDTYLKASQIRPGAEIFLTYEGKYVGLVTAKSILKHFAPKYSGEKIPKKFQNILGLIPFDSNFPKEYIDFDGYPKANLKFKSYGGGTGEFELQYIMPDGSLVDIAQILNGDVTYFYITNELAQAKIKFNKIEGGRVSLGFGSMYIGVAGNLNNLQTEAKFTKPIYFGVDFYNGPPLK